MSSIIIHDIDTLYTSTGSELLKGEQMNHLMVLHKAYIVIENDKIIALGTNNYQKYLKKETVLHNAKGLIAIPGLIDSHTHLVHGGSRESEFAMKLAGVPYLDILKRGGGILNTVGKTRAATFESLYEQAYRSLDEMLLYGVTTLEAKSGYGLDADTEIKQLEVARELNNNHPVDIVSTYMGAHAFPPEYQEKREQYLELILNLLDTIAKLNLTEAVDVFCENEVFSLEETEIILTKAKELGFRIRMHADEIHPMGGAGLAAKLQCVCADHLMAVDEVDMDKMAEANTVANLLPQTSFYLNKNYAPARKMLSKGMALALSSDYNPGSAPSENYQFVMQLAANKMALTPFEILNASTINPAVILNRNDRIGSIEIGKQADIVLLKAPNLEYVLYHFGINHTVDVFKNGRIVVKNRQRIEG